MPLPTVPPTPPTAINSFLYVSKFPDKPGQIRDFMANAVRESKISQAFISTNSARAITHSFQVSCNTAPLLTLIAKFLAAQTAIAVRLGRPRLLPPIPLPGAPAIPPGARTRYGSTGKVGDKITIEIVFRPENGLLDVIYRVPETPFVPVVPPPLPEVV